MVNTEMGQPQSPSGKNSLSGCRECRKQTLQLALLPQLQRVPHSRSCPSWGSPHLMSDRGVSTQLGSFSLMQDSTSPQNSPPGWLRIWGPSSSALSCFLFSSFLSHCWPLIYTLHPKIQLSIWFLENPIWDTCPLLLLLLLIIIIIITFIGPNENKSKTACLFSIWYSTTVLRLKFFNVIARTFEPNTLSIGLSLSLSPLWMWIHSCILNHEWQWWARLNAGKENNTTSSAQAF